MLLKNKIAIITGGNSGIGLSTAELFLQNGTQVVITGTDQATTGAKTTWKPLHSYPCQCESITGYRQNSLYIVHQRLLRYRWLKALPQN